MSGESLTFNSWAQPNEKASSIVMKYQSWQGFRQENAASWSEIDAYRFATDTTSLPNDASAFDHTTHIPVIGEIHDDLEAILYSTILPHNDWLGWKPFDSEAATEDKRKKALSYIKNRHSLNGFRQSVRELIDDYIAYGNAFCQVVHCDETYQSEDGIAVGYIGPKLYRISPYEIVFNPTAKTFKSSPKIIREVVSIGEFIKRSRTESNQYNKSTVDKVVERRGTYHLVDMVEQNENTQYVPDGFNSIESYMESGEVEILWFYGDVYDEESGELHEKRCVGVVDRFNVLFDFECANPRIHHVGWNVKPDNLWAQSPLARIVGLNYQINHRENAKSDAIDKYIYPDRLYVGDVDEVYDDETGQTKYIAGEGGSVTDIAPDTTVLTFDSHIDRLTAQSRSAARLPPQLAGFRTPGEKTLGEVQSLNDGAFRGFIHKAEHFELELLEPVISDEIEIGRTFLSNALEVDSQDEDGLSFLSITPL